MGSVYLVSLIFVGLSMLVSSVLRSRFAKYNNVRLAAGLTGKEIAEKMNLSPRTIDGYRDDLFERLNIKSRVGLVIFAIKNKIVNV